MLELRNLVNKHPIMNDAALQRHIQHHKQRLDAGEIFCRQLHDNLAKNLVDAQRTDFEKNYIVSLFGSQLTGLSSDTSDLDVMIGSRKPTSQLILHPIALYDVFNINMIPGHEVFKYKGRKLPYNGRFALTSCKATAKVGRGKKIECVFNKNIYQHHNSHYIKNVFETDVAVLRFLILVKTIVNLGGLKTVSKLTSYASILLAIFFLQERAYLPTLASLQPNYNRFDL